MRTGVVRTLTAFFLLICAASWAADNSGDPKRGRPCTVPPPIPMRPAREARVVQKFRDLMRDATDKDISQLVKNIESDGHSLVVQDQPKVLSPKIDVTKELQEDWSLKRDSRDMDNIPEFVDEDEVTGKYEIPFEKGGKADTTIVGPPPMPQVTRAATKTRALSQGEYSDGVPRRFPTQESEPVLIVSKPTKTVPGEVQPLPPVLGRAKQIEIERSRVPTVPPPIPQKAVRAKYNETSSIVAGEIVTAQSHKEAAISAAVAGKKPPPIPERVVSKPRQRSSTDFVALKPADTTVRRPATSTLDPANKKIQGKKIPLPGGQAFELPPPSQREGLKNNHSTLKDNLFFKLTVDADDPTLPNVGEMITTPPAAVLKHGNPYFVGEPIYMRDGVEHVNGSMGYDPEVPTHNPVGFEMELPDKMLEPPPAPLATVEVQGNMSLEQQLGSHLPDGGAVYHLTEEGGTSSAYVSTKKPRPETWEGLTKTEQAEWMMANGIEAIKIPRIDDPVQNAIEMKKAFVMPWFFNQLAKFAKIDGKRFMRAAAPNPDMLAQGKIVNKYIAGPSLIKVYEQYKIWHYSDAAGKLEIQRKFFDPIKLSPDHARNIIAATQKAYLKMNDYVRTWQHAQSWAIPDNPRAGMRGKGNVVLIHMRNDKSHTDFSREVAFDMLHGTNLHWDPNDQMLVAIDVY